MGKFVINPFDLAKNVVGLGWQDYLNLNYKSSVYEEKILDDKKYYKKLYESGIYDGKEFRMSKTAYHTPPNGIPIADRFIEFIDGVDGLGNPLNLYLVESPIIKCNRSKIINKTHVFGYRGTIKEFLTLSDWQIEMTFYIYGKRRMELDYRKLNFFLDFANSETSISVNSPILNDVYEIDKVVIDNITSVKEHGEYNNVFEVNVAMLSDSDYVPFTKTKSQ